MTPYQKQCQDMGELPYTARLENTIARLRLENSWLKNGYAVGYLSGLEYAAKLCRLAALRGENVSPGTMNNIILIEATNWKNKQSQEEQKEDPCNQ